MAATGTIVATVEAVAFVEASRTRPDDDWWGGELATIRLADGYGEDALQGLEAFSHVEVVFLFHEADPRSVVTGARHPRGNRDWPAVGIFAQRAKNRPNRIGTTMARVKRVDGRTIVVDGLDAIDGTPVLDLKPVMKEFLPGDEVTQPAWTGELMRDYWSCRPERKP